MKYYLDVLKKYAVFTGRASRQEFWMFVLFNVIIGIVLSIVDNLAGSTYTYYISSTGVPLKVGYIQNIYSLIVLLPNLGVSVRRLHDVNKSGLLILLVFVPVVLFMWTFFTGAYMLMLLFALVMLGFGIWLLVLYCTEGTRGPNKYGEDPYGNGGFKFSFEEDAPLEEQ
jgi:uncharacterized membrane protein YhaH (DUF805 family)